MKCFCDNYNLKSLIKQSTCYKNPDNPTCIDLLLANAPRSFQSTCVLEKRLSDFHLMTLTVMGKIFKKLQPRAINSSSTKNFSNEKFKSCLLNELRKEDFVNNDKGFEKFCNISINALSKHAPRKKEFVRGNQRPFMKKDFSKEIMKRSRLCNRFLKYKSLENRMLYTQQRNYYVSLLRKTKIRFCANLNKTKILDNKQFWKVVKLLFSDKSISGNKINLTENGKYIKTKMKTAEVFNSFFSNVVKNLKIPQYSNSDPIAQNIEDPTLKAIEKYKNHSSILTIEAKYKGKNNFSFTEVTRQNIKKEIYDLETKKASQISHLPTKFIKKNLDVYADFLLLADFLLSLILIVPLNLLCFHLVLNLQM